MLTLHRGYEVRATYYQGTRYYKVKGFAELASSLATARKWIDADIIERGAK